MNTKIIVAIIVGVLLIIGGSIWSLTTKRQDTIKSNQNLNSMDTTIQPTANTAPLSIEDAQAMVALWITESRAANRDITGSLESDLPKGLPVRIKAAVFRYDSTEHRLLVSGLVRYDVLTPGKSPVI